MNGSMEESDSHTQFELSENRFDVEEILELTHDCQCLPRRWDKLMESRIGPAHVLGDRFKSRQGPKLMIHMTLLS